MIEAGSFYFFWSVLAFILVFFLPGSVLLRCFGVKENFSTTFLVAVPLSLLFNYIAVFCLTILGFYTTPVYRCVAFVLLVAWLLFRKKEKKSLIFKEDFEFSGTDLVFFLISAVTLIYFVTRWVKSFGSIIDNWDVVFSWNRWAKTWYHSQLPHGTLQYPQLVSIIYSISYQICGSDILQFCAKATVTAFPIFGACAFFSLGFLDRSLRGVAFLSPILFIHFVNHLVPPLTGLADAPVASTIAILLCLCLAYGRELSLRDSKTSVYFISLVAALSCLVKGSALPYLVFFPILIAAFSRSPQEKKLLLKGVLVSIATILTWYGYKQYQIYIGQDVSALKVLSEAIGVPDFKDRPLHALQVLYGRFFDPGYGLQVYNDVLFLVFISLSVVAVWFTSEGAVILGGIFILFLIWGFSASYDGRNFSPASPLLALLPAMGFSYFYFRRSTAGNKKRFSFSRLGMRLHYGETVLAVALLGSLSTGPFLNFDHLHEKQIASMKRIEWPDVNDLLYQYQSEHPFKGKIMSAYSVVGVLPGLEDLYVMKPCGTTKIEGLTSDIHYLLVASFCSPSYQEDAKDYERNHKFLKLGETRGYTLYGIL